MKKGRKQNKIELLGKITPENIDIWKEDANEAEEGKFSLLVFKFPKAVKPTQLERTFELLIDAEKANI